MDGKYEYSYSDGDQWYQWSPDSKWILTNFIGIGGWNNTDGSTVFKKGYFFAVRTVLRLE